MNARRAQQRGAVTLVGVLFVLVTMSLMIGVLHRNAGSGILDSAALGGGVEALFLAESGLERAAAALGNGSCDSSLAGIHSLGSGSFTIEDLGAGFATDFSGAALAADQCRIRVTGSVPTLGSQRVVESIFLKSGNLLASVNPNFDDPPGFCWGWWPTFCTVTGWNLPAGGWDDTGGPDGSRAAQVWKWWNGGSVATTAGSMGLTSFTVTAPVTLTLTFDYNVQATGGGGSNKADLDFSVTDGTTVYSAPTFNSPGTSGFVTASISIPVTGSGPVTLTEFQFSITATSGQPKRIWLDNLDLQSPTGGAGTVTLLQWRELVIN